MPSPMMNVLFGSFGAAAAVLVVGGSLFLRGQRARQRHELNRLALERGLPLPETHATPVRQAWSIVAIGVGLILVGSAAWWLGTLTAMPAAPLSAGSVFVASNNAAPPTTLATEEPALAAPPRPRGPWPELEAWHAAQERVAVGQTAAGCGVVLTLLGLVRRATARADDLPNREPIID